MTSKSLSDYIISHADSNENSDFLLDFRDVELYFSMPPQSNEESSYAQSQLRIMIAEAALGKMAFFYTNKADSRLSDNFGGLPLLKAIEMVLKMPEADGLIIQSNDEAWFGADKNALKRLF
jgi:hypothetical protein